jgi:hypothetical protein
VPGFLRGYWMYDPEPGKAHSVTVFATSAAAQEFKTVVSGRFQAPARLGITSDILRTVDVIASAAQSSEMA